MTTAYITMEKNMSVRVYLCRNKGFNTAEHDRKFALDILGLIQGPLDLDEVETYRRSTYAVSEIPRLRMEGITSPQMSGNGIKASSRKCNSAPNRWQAGSFASTRWLWLWTSASIFEGNSGWPLQCPCTKEQARTVC